MIDEPLAMVVEFHAAPGRADDLRRALLGVVGSTRAEDGCLRYDLHHGVDDPDVLTFYEIWASRAAHAAHDRAAHIVDLVARLPELTSEAPRVVRLRLIEPD
jgi:quinol monooxygenase YgiN